MSAAQHTEDVVLSKESNELSKEDLTSLLTLKVQELINDNSHDLIMLRKQIFHLLGKHLNTHQLAQVIAKHQESTYQLEASKGVKVDKEDIRDVQIHNLIRSLKEWEKMLYSAPPEDLQKKTIAQNHMNSIQAQIDLYTKRKESASQQNNIQLNIDLNSALQGAVTRMEEIEVPGE